MKQTVRTVKEWLALLREAKPVETDVILEACSISVEYLSDYQILQLLDVARKAYDLELARDSEIPMVGLGQVKWKRYVLNSLRKYSGYISYLPPTPEIPKEKVEYVIQHPDGSDIVAVLTPEEDTHGIMASLMEYNAYSGFVRRNNSVRGCKPPKHLVPIMRSTLARLLKDFSDAYEHTIPRFGNGAVSEGSTLFERWEALGDNPSLLPTYDDFELGAQPSTGSARLCAVPKDWNKHRLITVEPSDNTYLQHKARIAISKTLCLNGARKLAAQNVSGMDVPDSHRRQAIASSAPFGKKIDTIDLSDASDSISWDAVVAVFPADVVAQLERARTPTFTIRPERAGPLMDGKCIIPTTGGAVKLAPFGDRDCIMHIYGGMGNATTFLVETLYFYALMESLIEYHRLPTKWERLISVFGDDLVCPFEMTPLVMSALGSAGLRVNATKTFVGVCCHVRESCGVWAYQGQDMYVAPFHGYEANSSGLLGLAEFIRNAPMCVAETMAAHLSEWPNTSVPMPNTISVCAAGRPVTPGIRRYNSNLQRIEWNLKGPTSRGQVYLSARLGGALAVVSRQLVTKSIPIFEALSSLAPGETERIRTSKPGLLVHLGVFTWFPFKKGIQVHNETPSSRGGVVFTVSLSQDWLQLIRVMSHICSGNFPKFWVVLKQVRKFVDAIPPPGERRIDDPSFLIALNALLDFGRCLTRVGMTEHELWKLASFRVNVISESIPYSVRLCSSWFGEPSQAEPHRHGDSTPPARDSDDSTEATLSR